MTTTFNDPRFTPPLEDGSGGIVIGDAPDLESDAIEGAESEQHADFLRYAVEAYQSSTSWLDSSLRATFEKAMSQFRGVHPAGSKYNLESYKLRSKIFRPKTRSAIRRGEAGNALAFFSTHDVVHCSAVNPSDPRQQLAAEVHNALLNARLNRPDMQWFKTVIGGAQDAMTVGVVISKQYWRYEAREQSYAYAYEEPDGTTTIEQGTETVVLTDKPDVQILPIENIRIDPACDWRDPMNSSPYVIELQPTYVHELQSRVESGRYWHVDTRVLAAAVKQDWDSIRKMREGSRVDKYDATKHVEEFRSVWVHHNIIRINGQDFVYDTLGTEYLLEAPRPIEEVYAHTALLRRRPYEMGVAIIESHKNYPIGIPALIEDLQEEANDVANLRLDNVKHAINKRWFVKRGRNVDIRALVRNSPGSAVMVTNDDDVREVQTQDVTSSSYQEQNRIDLDIDDIIGNFSTASVQANRSLNQTVGGMSMLQGDASLMQEYMIRTISETWVEPVMRQLVALEAVYESDEEVLRVVSDALKQDVETVMDVMMEPVSVHVNVGFQATNPQKRIEKLALGLSTIANFAPDMMQQLDRNEVIKEVFGALGFNNGARFFPSIGEQQDDPRIAALEQQVQQLAAMLEGKQLEMQNKVEVAHIQGQYKLAGDKIKADIEVMKLEAEGSREGLLAMMKNRLEEYDRMLQTEKTAIDRQRLWLEREALSHQIQKENAALAQGQQAAGGAFDLRGNDRAGVINRDQYDMIPQSSM